MARRKSEFADLDYNPLTGIFTWRVKVNSRAKYGAVAGCWSRGYWVIRVAGKLHGAHRLAWFFVYGKWPEQIDHINGIQSDNRIANLRLATTAQNAANMKRPKDNTTGFKGVSFKKGKWRATIKHAGHQFQIGTFATPEEAHAAYVAASRRLFGEFARAG
jgi:HNH endonuclease